MNKFIIVCLFAFGVLFTNAQTRPTGMGNAISGKIVDEKNAPIYGANILLLNADSSSALNGASTDEQGKFMIERVRRGKPYLRPGGNHPPRQNRRRQQHGATEGDPGRPQPDPHHPRAGGGPESLASVSSYLL